MKNEEAHIIKQILAGDTDRFSYFLDKYGQQVFRLISGIISVQEDAEELTQDAFMKAFTQLANFKQTCGFSTWLYRIAYNTAISGTRRRQYTERFNEERLDNLPDDKVDEALDTETEEQCEQLILCIERLHPEDKALITLFYREERAITEVAEILHLSESNVKVKLHRIRKKLYLMMSEIT